METIEVYIVGTSTATTNATATDQAAWAAVLTYRQHHKILTASVLGQTTATMTLTAFVHALQALKRYDLPVTVHTTSAELLTAFNQQQYVRWQQNNWRIKDQPVPDAPLWQTLVPLIHKFMDLTLNPLSTPHKEPHYLLAQSSLKTSLEKLS